MKNSIYLFILALILFQSCNGDDTSTDTDEPVATCENCSFTCLSELDSTVITNTCIDNWECAFEILRDAKIDLNEDEVIRSGNKNVFQMENSTQGSPLISDDEFTNILILELDAAQNSFSVTDSELQNMKVSFRRVCFCAEVEFKAVTSGCLQGEKQSDGTWFIQGDLVVPYSFGDIDVEFEAQFAE